MTRTQDLVEYIKNVNTGNAGVTDIEIGYRAEIVARLRAHDKLKESIEKMIRDCRESSKVDE